MSKQIDAYSFALGVCEAFCEVVRAGVKRIALSHPFTEDELQNALGADFLPACEAVARKYGCKAYYLKEPLIAENNYTDENRRQIAVRYGHLLSYSDEAIARYLSQNTELE